MEASRRTTNNRYIVKPDRVQSDSRRMASMNVLFRIVIGIQTLLGWLLTPYFRCRARRKPIPKIRNDILSCSATILAQKIREKKVSCKEVITVYINRIKEVNPIINAVVDERFSDALEEADKIDKIIMNDEFTQELIAKNYPLLGVPMTVKESCSLKGSSYCVGSKKRIGLKALEDGDAVSRLKKAGAIPLLVSNTPEKCCGWESTNLVTGRTLNPYHTGRTSGGSSGGEGALLGCGASVIGVGSDIAGSIRLPAMWNGVYGHKPTPGVIPIAGHYPTCPDKHFPDYLVIGPMTRFAEDLKLMTNIMCNNPEQLKLDRKVDISKLNIYFLEEAERSIVLPGVENEIKSALKKCLNHLKQNCGASVCDYNFDMENTCEMSSTLLYKMENIPNVLKESADEKIQQNLYFELLKAIFGCSEYSLLGLYFYFLEKKNVFVARSKYSHFCEKAEDLKRDFVDKLGENGIFLYPTFPTSAFEHNKILLLTAGVMYTMVFNILGLPSTHIPLGRNRNGLPIGIQVVAGPYQDILCFTIAEELEKCFGGWTEP